MKNLCNLKISVMCDNYNIQFTYATPKKIDFFTLALFEIIKHQHNFKNMTLEEILLKLEIPRDLHYIFNDRLAELMRVNPVMINCASQEPADNLLKDVRNYSLTHVGEEAYGLKEIIEEPRSLSREYIYNPIINSFIQRDKINIADSQNTITVEMKAPHENEVKNILTREISENPKKYIKNANPKTKIFNLIAAPTARLGIQNIISVSINDGKLMFNNDNQNLLKAFLSANAEEKKSIRKMFNYLNIPQTKVNFDKAALPINRSQYKIKMKTAFGSIAAINAAADAENAFNIDQIAYKGVSDFCFAGFTDRDRPLIYKYCEITDQGFSLPLEELDYSDQNYNAVFSSVFEALKDNTAKGGNIKSLIDFAVLASPPEQKTTVVKSLLEQSKDLKNALEKAKLILNNNAAVNIKDISNTVKNTILDLIKESLSKGGIDADSVISIMKEMNLPKERAIKILAECSPRTDKTINALLAVDETATVRIYELVKLYNSLLKSGELHSITHNNNIYSAFSDYDRQIKKLKTLGFESYYKYNMPKNWDEFMKEVYILKGLFGKIKYQLENDTVKQATDFFTRIENDYDTLAPIDEMVIKKLLDSGDLHSAIKSAKEDDTQIALAGIIRNKYEESLRALEKAKNPKATGDRKGKDLIVFAVGQKKADEVHRHWRNLCTLVHKATAINEPLWKGSNEDRKKALDGALAYHDQKFSA